VYNLALSDKSDSGKDLTPVAKTTPITEHFQYFLADMKRVFGGCVRPDEAVLVRILGAGVAAAARQLFGLGRWGGQANARLSQWLLRAGFRDSIRLRVTRLVETVYIFAFPQQSAAKTATANVIDAASQKCGTGLVPWCAL